MSRSWWSRRQVEMSIEAARSLPLRVWDVARQAVHEGRIPESVSITEARASNLSDIYEVRRRIALVNGTGVDGIDEALDMLGEQPDAVIGVFVIDLDSRKLMCFVDPDQELIRGAIVITPAQGCQA